VRKNGDKQELTVSEAGRIGGITTATRYGNGYYRRIGQLGQLTFAQRYGSEDRRRWGRMGGRPRRKHYPGEDGNLRQRRQGEPARSYSILPHEDYNTEETEESPAKGDRVTVKK
jgi:hypothetical protein